MANQVTYGFHGLKDIFNERIADTNVEVVSQAWLASVEEHKRQLDAFLGLFVMQTTEYKRRFQSAVNARLQPLDSRGKPLPVKPAGYYEIGLPIQAGGIELAMIDIARAKMTVGELDRRVSMLLLADYRWVRDHILSALFTNVTWTFPDPLYGNLTVQPLANGDTVTYQIMNGADSGATDTHFLAQAAAIADGTNPFPTIRDELNQHPENSGDIVALVPTNLRATVEGLTLFRESPDPNLTQPSTAQVLSNRLGVALPGEVFGYVDGVYVAEWRALPDSYIIATTTGGDRALAMREWPEAELQGFRPKTEFERYPYWERDYVRWAGFGSWNRVGAVVQRVGNGSYAIPTGYSAPMA